MIEYRYSIEDLEEWILLREYRTIKGIGSRYVQPIIFELPGTDFMQQENKKIEDNILEKKISMLMDQLHESYTRITGSGFINITYDPLNVQQDYYL